MSHELKGREILKSGTWNGIEFNDADLEDIAANFERLKDTHKVPLKFGHDEDQPITDGQPAIGWISRVFAQGGKLYADFAEMPRTVFESIKAKLYRTVSVEVLFNVDNDGKKFNHVLDAVALLGATKPAVSGLADLDALLATRTRFTGGHRVAFETIAGTSKKLKTSEVEMDKKEVQELIDAATKPLAEANVQLTKDLKEANEKVAKFTSDKADDEKKVKEDAVKLARKSVTDLLDTAVRDKSLTPANREIYEKQIGLDDDVRVIEIDLEQVKVMFNVKPKDEQQGLHKSDDDEISDKPTEQLLALTRKNRGANETFAAAFSRTCEAQPELHKAYLDANGEV